jgi:capsular polysaccharide biosynthesis protein
MSEEKCEDLFRKYGFKIIYPEKMAFPEQVRLFSGARYIAGAVGSGMHNILFSLYPDNIRVLFLVSSTKNPPDSLIEANAMIESEYGRKCFFVSGYDEDTPVDFDPYKSYWKIPIGKLEAAIRQWFENK